MDSPRSPQGSTASGRSASRVSSKARPLKFDGNTFASMQVSTARTPASSMSRAKSPVGRPQSGNTGVMAVPARGALAIRAYVFEKQFSEHNVLVGPDGAMWFTNYWAGSIGRGSVLVRWFGRVRRGSARRGRRSSPREKTSVGTCRYRSRANARSRSSG
jgi:hypothetical protein